MGWRWPGGTDAALAERVVGAGAELSGAGLPQAASGQELLIFSAVILGGTSLWGGRASVAGSLLAIMLINVLYSGLTLEQISAYWQTILQGVLLIAAVHLVQQGREPAWRGGVGQFHAVIGWSSASSRRHPVRDSEPSPRRGGGRPRPG